MNGKQPIQTKKTDTNTAVGTGTSGIQRQTYYFLKKKNIDYLKYKMDKKQFKYIEFYAFELSGSA